MEEGNWRDVRWQIVVVWLPDHAIDARDATSVVVASRANHVIARASSTTDEPLHRPSRPRLRTRTLARRA